jgi:hypothetical protein
MIVDEAMLNLWHRQKLTGDFDEVLARLRAEWLEHIDFRVAENARDDRLKMLESKLSRLANLAAIERQKTAPLRSLSIPRSTDWSNCAVIQKWYETTGFPSDAKLTMQARHQDGILLLRASDHGVDRKLKATDKIWDGDEWEFMLTARQDKKEFLHLLVNAEGQFQVLLTTEANRSNAIEAKDITVASTVEGTTWRVDIALPLTVIPGQGDALFGNFFRSANNAQNAQSWNPVFDKQFRERSAFGALTLER